MSIKKIRKKRATKFFTFKKITFTVFFIVLAWTFLSLVAFSKTESSIDMERLINHPKLNNQEAALRDFLNDQSTTRVIVNLRPSRSFPIPGFKHEHVRNQVKQEVTSAQDQVINAMDPDHVRITNRFPYIFSFSAEVTQTGLQALLDHPLVLSIDEDGLNHMHTYQGIPLMNADWVRETYNGSGVSIAICDTGIDYTHPRLRDGSPSGFPNAKVIGGRDTGEDDLDPMDREGHGTSCAGIAAGDLGTVDDYIGGVAYNARLYAYKVTNTPTGGSAWTSDIVEAWQWCVTDQDDDPNNPIMIISTSFGGGRYTSNCDSVQTAYRNAAIAAKAVGITLFASSGNDGFCDELGRPACISHVVSVGAVYDDALGGIGFCVDPDSCVAVLESQCDYNSTLGYACWNIPSAADMVCCYSNTADFLTLLAPSTDAYTLDLMSAGGYEQYFGGTSAACPYAAGAAACLQSAAKSVNGTFLSPDDLESYLVDTGDLITDGKAPTIIKPRINLARALLGVTLVVVSDFRTYSDGGSTIVQWETAFESNTIGFHLLRYDKSQKKYIQVNNKLLPGLLHSPQGGIYRFIDTGASTSNKYKLVEVESTGRKQYYGPFEVKTGQRKGNVYLQPMRSKYQRQSHRVSLAKVKRTQQRKILKERNLYIKRMLPGKTIKMGITRKGIYFLSTMEISNRLGLGVGEVIGLIQSSQLNLSCQGQNVAWHTDKEFSGIYFYGQDIDSLYSRENIYWLKRGQGIQMEPGIWKKTLPSPVNSTFTETIHVEQDRVAAVGMFNNPHSDYWLWESIVCGHPDLGRKHFFIRTDGKAPGSHQGIIKINLFSATNVIEEADHFVKVRLNGSLLGAGSWDGINPHQLVFPFNQHRLKNGVNTIVVVGFRQNDVPYSIFYVDSFDISYQRTYQAFNNRLLVRGGGHPAVTVSGFTAPGIMVFNVTDPIKPKIIRSATEDEVNGFFQVSFASASPDAVYAAVAKNALLRPAFVVSDTTLNLQRKSQGADYLIITPEELKDVSEDLGNYRSSSGLSSMVVTVEDIYDSFNHGIPSPDAIQKFLKYAYQKWWKKPKYAVLIGKGTYDYKNVLGHADNLIPPLMVSTPNGLFATDSLYGDIKGNDGVPEIVVGRIPVMTAEELNLIINKIKSYERNGSTGSVMMVADDPDEGGNYTVHSDELAALVQGSYKVDKIYLSQHRVRDARKLFFDTFNRGVTFANFMGHAGINRLTHEGLLTGEDVDMMSNGSRLPVLTLLTCAAGNFSIPGYDSLSELMVLKRGGGAVAVWSPTGAPTNSLSRALGEGFFRSVFLGEGKKRLGDAVREAMKAYAMQGYNPNILALYNILGDPALNLK